MPRASDFESPSGLRGAARRAGDVIVGRPERRVFAIFGHFLPDTSVINQVKFQHLLSAKFLADAGRDSVTYAAIIAVVYNGGGAFGSALIGLASLIPSIFFALYGGAISDSLPKRTALAVAYGADVALLIFIPLFFGDSTPVLFVLVFLITTLTQISSPAEKTFVPLVTSEEQLATANSLMGLTSSFGTAFGTAFLAPILLKAFGVNAVFFISAGLLLAAMTRVVHIDSPADVGLPEFIKPRGTLVRTLRWLARNRSVASMIGVSAITGMGFTIMTILAPTYVAEVLGQDPANTVYVMGIAGVGTTISLALVPPLLHRFGERAIAGVGFLLVCLSLVALGMVESGALDFTNNVNPIHWLDELLPFVDLNTPTEVAMFVAFPLGVGAGLTDNSVTTYLNRRVPISYQGRTFAARGLAESALTIPPLLGVSAIAGWVGTSAVLLVMPIVFYVMVVALLRGSFVMSHDESVNPRRVFRSYWTVSDDKGISTIDDEATNQALA